MNRMIRVGILGLASNLLFVGCKRTVEPVPMKTPDPKVTEEARAKYMLASEPAGGKNVKEMKENAKDGDDVVIVGRIGGSHKPFTGRAAFTLVDVSFKPCNEIEGDSCPTPWDYCCASPDELRKGTVLVKLTDAAGKTLPDDPKKLLNVKELQTLVVKGQIRRDDANSISVVASGIFVKKQ